MAECLHKVCDQCDCQSEVVRTIKVLRRPVSERWSIMVCVLVVLIGQLGNALPPPPPPPLAEDRQEKALERLMKVFGVPSSTVHPHSKDHHHPHRHKTHLQAPPQYMLDLYNSIADSSGVTKTPNPYNANVIRCLPDRDLFQPMHFQFNLSGVESNEKVLQAEFHVYKTKPSARALMALRSKQIVDDVKSHLLEMRVYQVVDGGRGVNRLLDARRVSSYSIGWEVFHVKAAVNDWFKNQSTNHGLLVTLRSLNGEPADDNLIRVLKRRHHGTKHPILVLFTDDGRPRPPTVYPTEDELAEWNMAAKEDEDYEWENELDQDGGTGDDVTAPNLQLNFTSNVAELETVVDRRRRRRRRRRSTNGGEESTEESDDDDDETVPEVGVTFNRITDCTRHELYVDFEKIGWSSWIISPKGYNAYYCKGSCLFPLGQTQRPTNHATVQSIVHELQLQKGIGRPCCVPNKLFAINLLYFEGNGNVVLKYYEDMVAASCGCH